MRVALIQFNASADKPDNLKRALMFTEEALKQGASFVLLPEVFNWRGNTRDAKLLEQAAETVPGPTLLPFMALGRTYRAHILAGSILERSRQKAKVHNTSVLINSEGKVVAKYRKIHLFDARIGDKILREADFFIAGKESVQAKVNGFTVGLSICYDLRFPDLYARHAKKKGNILAVPSCFTKVTGQAHWESLLKARAIENLSYVLAPNQVGEDFRGVAAYGNSMIIDPWGKILARGSDAGEEIVYADIAHEAIDKARAILPGIIK